MRRLNLLASLLALSLTAGGVRADVPPLKVQPVISLQAHLFPHEEVTLLDGRFKQAQNMGRQYLLSLDPDRLLSPFYEVAGEKPKKPRYGGWESLGVSGHILGHWLSGATRMAATTGDPELKRRINYIVSELAGLQAKNPDSYVSGFTEKPFLEVFSGNVNTSSGLNGHWVPWYTMHKIFAGLIDAYEISGNPQALQVAGKLADWAKTGTDRLSDEQFQHMLQVEQGGMAESMAELYAITGEKKYLDLARRFTHHAITDPLAAGRDDLAGKHANTQIPKIVGAARIFELSGDDYYRNVASYFWEEVTSRRSYAFGGNSIDEHFRPLNTEPLGPTTAETCNTYNMLRLTKQLMQWNPDARYADYYERALYNQILASQNPDDGTMMYFISTKPGHFKVYCTPFDSMWCCTGTGLENPGRYAEAIYSHSDDALWVNLFIPSELQWKEKGFTIRQENNFPEAPATKLTLLGVPSGSSAELALHLRVPYWAAGPVIAKVNGKESARADIGPGWLTIGRSWAKGDTIDLSLPMNLHLYRATDNPDHVAVMYGPVVLAAAMGRENFPKDDHFADQNSPNATLAPVAPVLVSAKDTPASWLTPLSGKPLNFHTVGVARPAELTLMPFYDIHHERYSIYFDMLSPAQWAAREKEMRDREAALRELDRRTVDQLNTGEQQPDVDHQQKGDQSHTGVAYGIAWRDAGGGGWFSYQVKVEPGPMILRTRYWGNDAGARNFDILVEGTKIAEQRLNNNKPDEFFEVEYPIPESLTQGKSRVEVKFQARPNNIAGGLFGLRVLRK